jgi:hypothetical protein
MFAELFMDGSEGAICGSALLAAVVALGAEALRHRERATLVLFALLIAGLQTAYPLFVPPIVLAAAAILSLLLVARLRRGRTSSRELTRAALQLVGVVALAAAFTPVAFLRNVRYWIGVLNGSVSLVGLPAYMLPLDVLPGWVLQTREFYNLPDLGHATPAHLLLGALVPALMIFVIAFGVRRYRAALLILAVAAGASLLAYYTSSSRGCSYCVQRNLIPVAALAPAALCLGLAALVSLRNRLALALAVGTAAVVVVVIAHEGVVERQRLANGSYLLDTQARRALAALPAHSGPVDLEGFGQTSLAPMELPLVYNLVDEKTHGSVSQPTNVDDNRGLAYFGGPQPLGPSFVTNYAYVLTRLAGIQTQRRVIARYGAIALQQRVRDVDVLLTGGAYVDAARFDPIGTAWVANVPLRFLVVGGRSGDPAWLSIVLDRTVPVKVNPTPGLTAVHHVGSGLQICLRVGGSAPLRAAQLSLTFTPLPQRQLQRYAPPPQPRGVRLVSMEALTTRC